MPRKGRSVRDQVGQAWLVVPIALIAGLVYFEYGRNLDARNYRSGQRGARNALPRVVQVRSNENERRGGNEPSVGSARDTDEAPDCRGTLPANAQALIAQTTVADVSDCASRHHAHPDWTGPPSGFSMTVNQEGRATAVELTGEREVPEIFLACLRRVAASWVLPSPMQGECATIEIALGRGPVGNVPVVPTTQEMLPSDQ